MKFLFRTFLISLVFGVIASAQVPKVPAKTISDKDVKKIYNLALTDFLAKEKHILPQCGYPILKKKKVIYLLSEKVNKQALPKFTDFTFYLVEWNEIVKKAAKEDGFCYVSIGYSQVSAEKVKLAISENLEHLTRQQALEGTNYECNKEKNHWSCKATSRIIGVR